MWSFKTTMLYFTTLPLFIIHLAQIPKLELTEDLIFKYLLMLILILSIKLYWLSPQFSITEYHKLVAYEQPEFISYSSGSWKVQDQSTGILSSEVLVGCFLAAFSNDRRGDAALWGLFFRSIPLFEDITSWPDSHLLLPSQWVLRFWYTNLGGIPKTSVYGVNIIYIGVIFIVNYKTLHQNNNALLQNNIDSSSTSKKVSE